MTTVLSIGQYYLERHYAKGATRALPETPFQRIKRGLFHLRPGPAPEVAQPVDLLDLGAPHD